MTDDYRKKIDAARRPAEIRQEPADPSAAEIDDGIDFEPEPETKPYSLLSADRQRKVMVEFRFLTGNAKALAYSYLVGADFDPSSGIRLDFSGYIVTIEGKNLRPVFAGLVAQRLAFIYEMDELQAEAELPDDSMVVARIEVKEVE